MNTRMKKWKRYRRKIEKMPDNKFPQSDILIQNKDGTVLDSAFLESDKTSEELIVGKNNDHIGPYNDYKKKRTFIFVCKLMLLLLAVICFACLFMYWVR